MKPSLMPYFAWNASRYSARSSLTADISISLNVVSSAACCWAATSRSAIRRRMRLIGHDFFELAVGLLCGCSRFSTRALLLVGCFDSGRFGLVLFDVSQDIFTAEAGTFRLHFGSGQAVLAERHGVRRG